MARTEFDLAKLLRPRRSSEFPDLEELRRYLVREINLHRDRSRAGVLADFSSGTFEASSGFVRIGEGSLGGKGRGLAFIHTLLANYDLDEEFPGVRVFVPPTVVLASGVFDEFMKQLRFPDADMEGLSDKEIARFFLSADFPDEAMDNLRTLLSRARYPLAVRSSSLLEDSSYQPFAGVYRTYMIPNSHPDLEVRLSRLVRAVKLIYASIFFADARSYIESTPNRVEEEKMAIVIQQIVGRRRGDYLYPDVAGVARSYDFYPMSDMNAEDGVASIVLGLGRTVVEGGRSIRFSPARPRSLYQFSTVKDTLDSAQREFLALDLLKNPEEADVLADDSNLAALGLDVAEKDGVLSSVGSVYSPENDAVYDGVSRKGVRLVTMAGVLKTGAFPLARTLMRLLDIGRKGFSCHVEMEFAANIRTSPDEPHEFAFLQIRPIVMESYRQEIDLDGINRDDAICVTHRALGNGIVSDVRDIVYVPAAGFDRGRTADIAREIGSITRKLKESKRPYLLIGSGRWGSSDHWAGIPVTWGQISGVSCIVETEMADFNVEPSQGSHFFQNITSFGIGYFTVNSKDSGSMLDTKWLDAQPAEAAKYVRRLSFSEPLTIAINGQQAILPFLPF
jgi:hypothetical protein